MKPRRMCRGMTLIEVLVALALLALLALGMFSTFHVGQRSYQQVARIDAALSDIVATQRFLRHVLESAYPFEVSSGAQQRVYGFEGERNRLAFTALMPLSAGSSGHYRYELALAAAANGSRNLIVRARLDRNGLAPRGGVPQQPGIGEEVLIERVAGIELDYLNPVDSQWVSSWQRTRTSPALVRVRVLFAQDDPRRWPELVIAPRVTDDANCNFDTVAQACREVS